MRVIITGGNRGIGRAIVDALDADVAIVGRDEASLAAVGVPWAAADVSDRVALNAALDRLESELGGVDAVVANAGATGGVVAGRGDEETFDRVIAANLKGAYLTADWAARRLPRPGGALVLLSSIAAYMGGSAGGALGYAAAKAGVLGLTRALASELTPVGIAANAVAPGFIAGTDFFGGGDPSDRLVPQIPAGRAGHPGDVAAAVRYLLDAPYVFGQVLHVNGGWYLGG